VALVLLGVWFVGSLATLDGGSYEQVAGWLGSPLNAALALLFVVVAAYHASLGLQVVIEDYVAAKGTRTVVLITVKFALVVAAVVGVLAVLRIAFGVAA
jgi:succinate dehydrogenase / fumarate reductase membrane anchor subunit